MQIMKTITVFIWKKTYNSGIIYYFYWFESNIRKCMYDQKS